MVCVEPKNDYSWMVGEMEELIEYRNYVHAQFTLMNVVWAITGDDMYRDMAREAHRELCGLEHWGYMDEIMTTIGV